MNIKWFRQSLIWIVLIALIVSVIWTYISIKVNRVDDTRTEVILEIKPEYKITSRKNLTIWPEGTLFEQGMAAYFYAAEPELNVTPIIKISGLKGETILGTIQSKAIIRAVDDKAQVYWSYPLKQSPVQDFTFSEGEPGQESSTEYRSEGLVLDVSDSYNLLLQICDELMFQNGQFQLVVTSEIDIHGTVDGKNVEKVLLQELPLTLQSANFSVPKVQDVMTSSTLNAVNGNNDDQKSIQAIISKNKIPILSNITLVIFLAILIYLNNRTKSKAAIEHRRYKEWITEGSVEVKDKFIINILSLEGLVDLAIDLDRRVIYDSKMNRYYVLAEDIVYIYNPEHMSGFLDNRQQLGKLLLERGLIKPEQLEIGLYYQKKIGSKLGESLIALGLIDETTLYSALAAQQKIDYYELNTTKEMDTSGWRDKLSIQKARALMAVPIGVRADGCLVIASSEAFREGIQKALEEIFGSDLHLVAAKPSAIYDVLERLDEKEKQKTIYTNQNKAAKLVPYERLSEKEREQFAASYYRGTLHHELFMKASGLIDPVVLNQVPDQEDFLNWLVNRNLINGEIVNMLKGLEKIIEAMDFAKRKNRQLPELLDLLIHSNYITPDTAEWINRELILQKLPVDQLLCKNYLASDETIHTVEVLLGTLGSILNKSNV
ncbi:MAG: hypothetical protein K0S47_1276 [Herbinix sp.]|jgi:hypothetical protein|nr:hypothetical protein [Herbinix sp.]